jgi:hypothetical protein
VIARQKPEGAQEKETGIANPKRDHKNPR